MLAVALLPQESPIYYPDRGLQYATNDLEIRERPRRSDAKFGETVRWRRHSGLV